MRNLAFVLGAILLLFCVFDYLVIPNTLLVDRSIIIPVKRDGMFRIMTKNNDWTNSLHDNNIINRDKNEFIYNGNNYKINYKTISSVIISISNEHTVIPSTLTILPHEPDSTLLIWEMSISTSYNPLKRFNNFINSKKIGEDLNVLMKKLQSRYSNNETVYGIDVKKEEVNDSILVSTNSTVTGFPSTTLIYGLISNLKDFVKGSDAHITGIPMLNITTGDSVKYLVRVALPVDKELVATKTFTFKRMMGRGKILRSRVIGGNDAISSAMANLYNFMSDYHYVSPAIPFQSLITDRTIVTDSSKWVTDLYYPVM